MKRFALLAIPLSLFAAAALNAQQSTSLPQPTQPGTAPASPAGPPVTPREAAEMRADILMARKEYPAAIAAYQNIVAEQPKNAALLNKIGVAYQQWGLLAKAGYFYKMAMKADRTFASPVNNLGTVEYMKKRYGKSIDLYKKALEMHTDMSTIYSNLGYAYFARKDYAQAMDSFSKALALDPQVFERRSGLGSIVQNRSATDPGLFFFLVAKSYALAGDADRAAHYLKVSRDEGYKDFLLAEKDPAFSRVIQDPRVQVVLHEVPTYASPEKRPESN